MKIKRNKINFSQKDNTLKDKHTLVRIGFYAIVLIALVIKSMFFLGFIFNKDPYILNFSLGYRESIYFLNYYIAFALIFISISFLFKNKGKFISLILFDLFLTLLILMDTWYFRGFTTMPSALILTQTANLDNLGGSILSMASKYDIFFFIDFIILIFGYLFFKQSFSRCKSNFKGFIVTTLVCICYIGYVPFNLHILNNEDVSNSYLFSNYDSTDTAQYFSPIGYHIMDIYRVYKDSMPYTITSEDKHEIEEFYNYKNENISDNKYNGLFKDKNLIIIQVESLENFVIGKSINDKEITPNLNKLLNNSIYFPNIFEQVNEGTSSDSDLMINTSILPLRQGSTFFRYPNTTYNSLPNILENNGGYETIAIHPDKGSFWNYAQGLKGIGFDKFIDYYSFEQDEIIGLGISDGSYFRQIVPMIENLKEPFYAFTVTLTSHGPFDIPPEYRELDLPKELNNNVLGGYFESLYYTDKQIGLFLDELSTKGLLDDTVVAIVGDHTGVHKYYNNKIETLSNVEDWWLDDGNHVMPLIIYNNNFNSPVKIDTYGGQIDVMPTLLYLLGINESTYINTCMGKNLLKTNRSYAVLMDNTVKGDIPKNEEDILLNSLNLADKIIKGNYFK